VESFEEAFAKIEAATNIRDIDTLVSTFIKAEENNFALFRFVNDLSNEIEATELQIVELRAELKRYQGKGIITDSKRRKQLKDLEEKLSKTELRAEQFELEYQQSLKKVNMIKARIESIFTLVECDADETQDLLGNSGVTESNLMVYLGIIEQKINEILQAYAIMQ
jgi:hypothetical protein